MPLGFSNAIFALFQNIYSTMINILYGVVHMLYGVVHMLYGVVHILYGWFTYTRLCMKWVMRLWKTREMCLCSASVHHFSSSNMISY